MEEPRSIGLVLSSSNSPTTYTRIYKPGQFPGTADNDSRVYGALFTLLVKCRLPSVRVTTGNLSGRCLVLWQRQGGIDVELHRVNLIASSVDYQYNLISAFSSVQPWMLSADSEIGIALADIGYGAALAGTERLDIMGFSFEADAV